MMLPPGLAFNAIGPRAMEASKCSNLPKSYWRWTEMLDNNVSGFLPLHAGNEPFVRFA